MKYARRTSRTSLNGKRMNRKVSTLRRATRRLRINAKRSGF